MFKKYGVVLGLLFPILGLLRLMANKNSLCTSGLCKEEINFTSGDVMFIPFPHRTLGAGDDVQCTWSAYSNPVDSLGSAYDLIQRAAFSEGVCIPSGLRNSLRVFSTAEAIQCLSPTMQRRNITLAVSGDSYSIQLFIGLADILLGRAWNEEIHNASERRAQLNEAKIELSMSHAQNPSFPDIRFLCQRECYGKFITPFSQHCSRCMNALMEENENAVAVVGAGVHILETMDLNHSLDEVKAFLMKSKRVIFHSVPSYRVEEIPLKYKDAPQHSNAEIFYQRLLPSLAPQVPYQPFLDFFQLTKTCFMQNCSFDGGHRSRYVNRWKAQLLLNTVCEKLQ